MTPTEIESLLGQPPREFQHRIKTIAAAGAREVKDAALAKVVQIQAQLEHETRQGDDGRPMSPAEYAAWRKSAVVALRYAKVVLQMARTRVAGLSEERSREAARLGSARLQGPWAVAEALYEILDARLADVAPLDPDERAVLAHARRSIRVARRDAVDARGEAS